MGLVGFTGCADGPSETFGEVGPIAVCGKAELATTRL